MRASWGPSVGLFLPLCLVGCNALPVRPPGSPAPVRGVTLASWSADGYAAPAAEASLIELRETGANTVALLVTAYQPTAGASAVRAGDPRTPSLASVQAAATLAKQMGLRIALKLHVDLDDGSWRARIDPADPDAWFASYEAFALPWAALAESLDADLLVFATELAGTMRHEALWKATIAEIRGAFGGALCYSASWDEAGRVPFWDELDLVGVYAYFPVARSNDASRFDLLAGWQPWLARLQLLHAQVERPILLTELGYRSVDGAGMQPYDFSSTLPLDLTEQADLYWAALEATASAHGVHGVLLWHWPADGAGGPLDDGYSPIAKPAQQVLDSAW